MKNITVSVDEEIYHRARVRAAEQKTSVSAMVRELLREISEEKTEFERLKELEDETVRKIPANTFSGSNRLDRDEVHNRDAIR